MQLLLIHSDFIEFEAKRPTKMAEEVDESAKKGRLEEALCAFIAVEKFDEDDPDAVIAEGAKQIADVAGQVKASRIMIYPYAHLSPNSINARDRQSRSSQAWQRRSLGTMRSCGLPSAGTNPSP